MGEDWKTREPPPPDAAPEPARLRPPRTPILWVVAPLAVAYACAEAGAIPGAAALAGCAALGCATALIFALRGVRRAGRRTSPAHDVGWAAGLCLAVWALGALWHDAACPPPPDRAGLPPREAILSVRVEELFQSASAGVFSGIGRVEESPAHLVSAVGARIQFKLTSGTPAPGGADLGARLRLRGVLDAARDDTGFGRYLRGRGVGLTLSRAKCEALEAPASDFRLACTRARERVARALRVGVDEADGARLAALMLGRTSLLPKAEREDFRFAGATHLFAISGLHITGIAGGLLWALRRCRVRPWVAAPLVSAVMWLYVQMAGAPPSAMRAWVMAVALGLGWAMGRGARAFQGLALAAAVMLVADPSVARDPGFLLSYAAVSGLILHAAPLTEWADRRWRPWRFIPPDALPLWKRFALARKRAVIGAGAATLAAGCAGMPLTDSLFGRVSWVGLVANPLLIPLSAPAVLAGFVSSALGAAGLGFLAGPFNLAAALCLRATAWLAHVAAGVPGGSSATPVRPLWATGAAAAFALLPLLAYPPRYDRSATRFLALPAAVALWFAAWAALG